MLQPRIPTRDGLSSLVSSLQGLSILTPSRVFVRNASHASQGRANGPKDSAGRRLGAKKTASQWVIPGNIIYKQRGTLWFPGENCGIGKDHTIYSLVHGYVRYYRNPALHPKRRYIGVALAKEGPESVLPTPVNAPTRRRLGMHAVPMAVEQQIHENEIVGTMAGGQTGRAENVHPVQNQGMSERQMLGSARRSKSAEKVVVAPFDPKYATRHGGVGMANFEIGRLIDRAREGVEEFDRKDRWKAWRVRAKKIKEKTAARAAKKRKTTKGKKSNKKI